MPDSPLLRNAKYMPIAYVYDQDFHCSACTVHMFGVDDNGRIPTDAEDEWDNPVSVVAPWDVWYDPDDDSEQTLSCADCGDILATLPAQVNDDE